MRLNFSSLQLSSFVIHLFTRHSFPFLLRLGIAFCVLIIVPVAFAQQPATQTDLQVRQFDQNRLEQFRADEDFRYDREVLPDSPNWWQRFKQWLLEQIFGLFTNERTADTMKWMIYLVAGLVILYVILKLTKTNLRGLLFNQSARRSVASGDLEENIHALDFDALLAEAIARQQYGRAVRLHYLKVLKQLTDRDLISWRINKTNHDYERELRRPDLLPDFRHLTFLFEYICYGDFPVSQAEFEQARAEFRQFEQKISSQHKPSAVNFQPSAIQSI